MLKSFQLFGIPACLTLLLLSVQVQLITAADNSNTTKVNVCRVENLATGGDESGGQMIRLCNIVSEYGPSDNLMMAHIPDNIPDHSYIRYKDHHTSEGEDGLLHLSISKDDDDIDYVISEKEVRRLVAVKDMPRRKLVENLGEKTMLVVMVNSNRLTVTKDEVMNYLFGKTNSMSSQLKLCSQNQVWIKPLEPAIIEMKTEKAITEYRFMQLWRELGPKLRQQYGKSATSPIREIADHVFFVLPDDIQAPPGETAWAAIPGNYLGVMNRFIPSVMNTLHEMGHNFGLAHGYENGVEYDDQSTVMGTQRDIVKICFNGYHMKAMDWYWDRSHEIPTITNNGEIINVAYYGNYRYTSPDEHIWVSIGDFDIFLSFNRKKGINEQTIEYGDKLLIVQKRYKNPESITPYTELLAAIDVNSEPYILPNYQNGANLVIEVCNFTPQGTTNPDYLTVAVGTQSGLCTTATQAPNMNTDFPSLPPAIGDEIETTTDDKEKEEKQTESVEEKPTTTTGDDGQKPTDGQTTTTTTDGEGGSSAAGTGTLLSSTTRLFVTFVTTGILLLASLFF